MTVHLLAALVLVCAASPATPQSNSREAPRFSLAGSFLVSSRPAGPDDYHFITPMLGGKTAGFSASLGVFLAPSVSLDLEVSRPGTLAGELKFDHFLRHYWHATLDETMVEVFLHVRPGKGSVRFEPLGGMALTIEHVGSTDRRSGTDSSPALTLLPNVAAWHRRIGFGGGADLAVYVRPRLAVTASWRMLHFADRYDLPDAELANGVGVANWTYQAGVGLRWILPRSARNRGR